MWTMKWSLILFIVPSVVLVNSTTSTTYWWLGRASFGGRNYNLEDIANNLHNQEDHQPFIQHNNAQSDTDGEHIFDFLNDEEEVVKNSENIVNKPNVEIRVNTTGVPTDNKKKKLKPVKNRGKRQTSDRKRKGNGSKNGRGKKRRKGSKNGRGKKPSNDLRLDEIETECPVTLKCTARRACDTGGILIRDLIPCLHQSTGRIEVCCDKFIPSVCPEVRKTPPVENCEGEVDECDNVGSFCSDNHLCCFNGCKNICLEDPPLKVDTSFFFRSRPIISRGETKRPNDQEEEDYDDEEKEKEYYDYNDEEEEDYDYNDQEGEDYNYDEFPNEVAEDDTDFSSFERTSLDLTRGITIPVSLVGKISELLTILKDEEEQDSPLIGQINLILSSVENKSNPRKPRLLNTRTSRPPRRSILSRGRDNV